MTATGQHPMSMVLETLCDAGHSDPALRERLGAVAIYAAMLCSEIARLERYIERLENADSTKTQTIIDLRRQVTNETAGVPQ